MPSISPLTLVLALATSVLSVTFSFAQAPPASLRSLRVDPPTLTGGHAVQGTVQVAEAPGPEGMTVTLRSDYPLLAVLPPSVTIAPGQTRATFPIDTRAVIRDQLVTLKARAGDQVVEAELRLRRPAVQHASVDAPSICDGEREGTLKYLLSGPAPAGLQVVARTTVHSAGLGNSADSAGAVPEGQSEGSMRIRLPKCVKRPGERCSIDGWARVDSPAMVVTFSGASCGHSPY